MQHVVLGNVQRLFHRERMARAAVARSERAASTSSTTASRRARFLGVAMNEISREASAGR